MELIVIFIFFIILSFPIFELSKFILKKFKYKDDKVLKYNTIALTVFLSPIIYFSIFYLVLYYRYFYYPSKKFDKNEWHKNIHKRYYMSENIIASKMLIGKSKEQVINLLGKKYFVYHNNHYSYYLGMVPGINNIDPDLLDVYFENDIVVTVGQHES